MIDMSDKEEIKELKKDLKEKKEEIKTARQKSKQAAYALKNETKKQTAVAITAAFGFLIALAWRDVIKAYTDKIITNLSFDFPESLALLYTALITTCLAVVGIILINRFNKNNN